jgi:Fic family protein
MKRPQSPPDTNKLLQEVIGTERFATIMLSERRPLVGGLYAHWDKLRHEQPPKGLSHREWWLAVKLGRQASYRQVPLTDRSGRPFQYATLDLISEDLHHVDLGAGGRIAMPKQITNPDTKNRYYVGSLIEEAVTSSQLEGATTTRPVAKEMIRSGRPPRDRSERMIFNNFLTMKRISKWQAEPLTKELVLEIHRLVTDQTLDDPLAAGRFRRADEQYVVGDDYGEVFHEPPPAEELNRRMKSMCEFANGKTPRGFVHPVLRSIILHFWLAYDHPFVDGNGRTARALFYWSMLHHGYWLCEFISISQIIRKGPAKYGRAFLYTETDENDLTYFIVYHLGVLRRAIEELHRYINRKTSELQVVERVLQGTPTLNHRQRALLAHALRHPDQTYTFQSHATSHNVVPQTARTDLLGLQQRGLLQGQKIGKRWYFTPVPDLEGKLRRAT